MSNQSNVKKCRTRNPQKIRSMCLLKDIKFTCQGIIKNCGNNQLDKVVNQVDQLSGWLDQIDETEIMGHGRHAAKEMITILNLIHQANWVVISKGLSM
jgi:hypothetical protein